MHSPSSRFAGWRRHVPAVAVAVSASLLLGAAMVRGGSTPVATTVEDFFQPGTQPNTLTQALVSSDNCLACHGQYGDPAAPHDTWRLSMMAQSARDPVFYAALTIANQDADFAGELCIRCHTPNGWLSGRSVPTDGSALAGMDFEGITCNFCHRMVDPIYTNDGPGGEPDNPTADTAILNPVLLGGMIPTQPHSGTYIVDPVDRRRGPFDLEDFFLHPWYESPFHQESLLCSTCHDVSNPTLDRVGGVTPAPTDTYALNALDTANATQNKYEMFPVERTWSEWSQSAFAAGPIEMGGRFGGNKTAVSTCQDCHMPDATGEGCAIRPPLRTDLPTHTFLGANSWVLEAILDLDVSHELYDIGEESGLTEMEVQAHLAATRAFVAKAADLRLLLDGDMLTTRVVNQTGHKLPTGYPEGRRMWVNVRFFNAANQLIEEHGHYDFVNADLTTVDTKVYEAQLGLDSSQAAATGLPEGESFHFVLNNMWIKDNRIPPRGFTNAGFASVQAAPIGYSYADGQYWDDTEFMIPCDAVKVTVNLWNQTTSKEYIEFLRDENITDDRGDIAYARWLANGKSRPVLVATKTRDLDCNGNGVLDACDISMGDSEDLDGNGIPDDCRRRMPDRQERDAQY